MIQLNQPLQRMLRHSIKCVLVLCFVFCTGCRKEEAWNWEIWLKELSLQAGFSSIQSKDPLLDLKQFEVLNLDEYQKDDRLNHEMIVYTCQMLLDEEAVDMMEKQLDLKSTVTAETAQKALKWIVMKMNDIGSTVRSSVIYRQTPLKVQVVMKKDGWLKVSQPVYLGQLIEIDQIVYEVVLMENQWVQIEKADEKDVKEMDLEGTISFDPLTSRIVVQDEIVEFHSAPSLGNAIQKLSKSFECSGFHVRISTSSDSLHIYASKKTSSGVPVFVQFDINELTCGFKWKCIDQKIQAAALKASYETTLTSGLRTIEMSDRVLDFSKLDAENALTNLADALPLKSDCLEETIELAEIQMPFPEFPACTLTMKVLLHLYASGKAEVSFESDHEVGFETVNGNIRWINETEKQSHVALRASAKASTKLQFGLNVLARPCMDATAELGIQGICETRIMDKDGSQIKTNLAYEKVVELAEKQPDVNVCADLDAFWLMNLQLNSNKTVLGSLGLQKTIELLNSSNASLFGKKVHLEHFQIVDRCTASAQSSSDLAIVLQTDRIELKEYVLILKQGKTELIQITGLPDGITKRDLQYVSENKEVASVNSNGRIKAEHEGETIIKVSSKDGVYESQCSVFVK